MIQELKPYPEYKDSVLPWLGRIPAHWGEQPGFAVFREKQEKNTGMREKRVLSLSYGQIVIKPTAKLHGLVPDSFETYQIVNPGDLIIRSTDLQNDWTSLRVGLVRDRGIITSAYLCLKNLGSFTPEFAFLTLHSYDLRKFFYGLGSGLRQNLDFGDFKRLPFPVPPSDEQTAIVRFLNHANGQIERAVRAKKKLIALLNEQKQAIIHRAVTHGLDPAIPLKPSGIPWLSEAPAHWVWTPIKRLLSRMDYGTSEAGKGEGKIRLLTMGNIQRGEIILPQRGDLDSVPEVLLLEHHDLLFTRTNGNPDLVGKVGIFRGHTADNVSFASYLVRLRVNKEHSAEWLHMVLNSSAFWAFARSHALVNLQTNLNSTRYGQLAIPVPPPEEQVRIVDWVSREFQPVAMRVQRAEREIALLREYRTRLAADVVTGKLDVREAARRLPEVAVEREVTPDTDDLGEVETEDVEA